MTYGTDNEHIDRPIIRYTIMSQTIQTNSVGFTPPAHTVTKDQHSAEQLAPAEKESANHVSDTSRMCNSDIQSELPASTITEHFEIVHVLETTPFSIDHSGFAGEMYDCQGQTYDGTSCLSDKTFSHSNDTLSHGTSPLCLHRPGPKPPDLNCCYPKKFRNKDLVYSV